MYILFLVSKHCINDENENALNPNQLHVEGAYLSSKKHRMTQIRSNTRIRLDKDSGDVK